MEVEEIKKEYGKFEKKFKLPSFSVLNDNFEVGKIENDGGSLLRAVRKTMVEKVVNSMSFLDMLLNPLQAPRMYHVFIRAMSIEDKKTIDKIYGMLAEISVASLEREIDYDEKAEAELIIKINQAWEKAKPDFRNLIKNIQKPNNNFVKKDRGSYFG